MPEIIAHRGASGEAPENTMKAFNLAVTQGADGIEMDIRRCKSGEMVVIHDATLERTTGRKGVVKDYTLEQLKALDAGDGETIPDLTYVINRFRGRIRLFLELKEDVCAMTVAEMVSLYCEEQHCGYEDLVIISGLHSALAMVHRFNPQIYIGANLSTPSQKLQDIITYTGAKYLLPDVKLLTPTLIEAAGEARISLIPWTVNDKAQKARLEQMGISSIITDYPSRFTTKK